ncbi:hypothetical protein [Pectobacterium phage Jarilo]|uniref:Uncharacterized protein n=1 Tax=Pectobacterium phage Jarilo TaxID=2163634 RepID=A0A2S1GT20_9CAUD|nr:hypothetical protein HOT17_gp21 [Pectobacterium phage Jarilo]AWD92502.1 hypothetical protein [Pectobacterium phage Jarilo]
MAKSVDIQKQIDELQAQLVIVKAEESAVKGHLAIGYLEAEGAVYVNNRWEWRNVDGCLYYCPTSRYIYLNKSGELKLVRKLTPRGVEISNRTSTMARWDNIQLATAEQIAHIMTY